MKRLVIQILGNRDILYKGKSGKESIKSNNSLEDIGDCIEMIQEDFEGDLDCIDFPLIRQAYEIQKQEYPNNDIVFGFILTNQLPWLKAKKISGNDWSKFVALDGAWWKQILEIWCKQQHIDGCCIDLEVADPEITTGVADWEGMAEVLQPLLDRIIDIRNQGIYFRPDDNEQIQVGNLVLQHSSGTPALSGALYLWGIEKKLDGANVEFLYLSEEEGLKSKSHSGDHWQWRLKVPQIKQLVAIQDFHGAKSLSDGVSNKQVLQVLNCLDKAVSLNLDNSFNSRPRESAVERIAISLWSEEAFRKRQQWLHWYLRIAGAFELALLLLVEKQGDNQYHWRNGSHLYLNNLRISDNSIGKIVKNLLSQGSMQIKDRQDRVETTVEVARVGDTQWEEFCQFYLYNWSLGSNDRNGFVRLRNRLYHSLEGDVIDKYLDHIRPFKDGVCDPEHPAVIAVGWLEYIVGLAGCSEQIESRVDHYQQQVNKVLNDL